MPYPADRCTAPQRLVVPIASEGRQAHLPAIQQMTRNPWLRSPPPPSRRHRVGSAWTTIASSPALHRAARGTIDRSTGHS